MPEIKNTLTSGKMNKDLDERLVRKGEYRDAMNIQISTSEQSDVGAVENVLGNFMLHDTFLIPTKSTCVGAIADEKKDTLYWFTYHATKDAILKYDRKTGKVSPVLIDTNKNVLNFNKTELITGINIIDNLLFWTDNRTEPKKINIDLCEQGTDSTGLYHTRLVVPENNIDYSKAEALKEEHITVIKTPPKQKLHVEEFYEEYNPSVTIFNFAEEGMQNVGTQNYTTFTNFINGQTYNAGDRIAMIAQSENGILPSDATVVIKIIQDISGADGYDNDPLPKDTFIIETESIEDNPAAAELTYRCLKIIDSDPLFERKYPRFSYRYKYADGEYSTFAPFTDVIFKPGLFQYNSFKAYNVAMENRLKYLKLRNFITNETPNNVIQIDILYKESNSPTVYLVDKIKYNDEPNITVGVTEADHHLVNSWHGNQYEIKSDLIHAVLPSNQLLRPWDNVPRQALAQEITGNRIVYANYLQNYNISNLNNDNFQPILHADYKSRYVGNEGYKFSYQGNYTNSPFVVKENILHYYGHKSLKSMRNYQLGLTYIDKYGRETPIFSNNNSIFKIPKKHGGFKLALEGQINTSPPSFAESYKFYVKETSTEYYNIAMSRVYRAEDGNIWLAFPSSERNKIDLDTFLILKKGADKKQLIKEKARYKVLAIENEAPDFIKTETDILGEIDVTGTNVGAHLTNPPTVDSRFFDLSVDEWSDSNATALNDIPDPLRVEWEGSNGYVTQLYDVSVVTASDDDFSFTLVEAFNDSDSWIYPGYPSLITGADLQSGLRIRVYRDKIVNRPEFDGVFFVKINSDEVAEKHVFTEAAKSTTYEIQNKVYSHNFLDESIKVFKDPAGIQTTTLASNTATGDNSPNVTTSDDEWKALLDFGGLSNIPGGATGSTGGFFIDAAYYAGVHYDTPDFEFGLESQTAGFSNGGNYWTTESFSPHPASYQNRASYGRGIFTENGKHYVEISFSKIGDGASVRGSGQFNIENDAYRLNDTGWPDGLGMHSEKIWDLRWEKAMSNYQDVYGGPDDLLSRILDRFRIFQKFRISNNSNPSEIFEVLNVDIVKRYNHTDYRRVWHAYMLATSPSSSPYQPTYTNSDPSLTVEGPYNDTSVDDEQANNVWKRFQKSHNRRITFRLQVNKDLSGVILDNSKSLLDADNCGPDSSFGIEFVIPRVSTQTKQVVSKNPAIWETEPKESADLDIYYEASDAFPININDKNWQRFIPKGSIVTCPTKPGVMNPYVTTTVVGFNNNKIIFSHEIDTSEYVGPPALSQELPYIIFTRPDTTTTSLKLDLGISADFAAAEYGVFTNVHRNPFSLSWYNCFSFVNGVESNRIRDTFNSIILDKGAKASSVIDENYEQERRTNGLIYSGIYNSTSGVNNLNQFIQAEKITKDLNPTYGSIQKLYSRNSDLVALCEDKVIRILANKDAVFNADGNANLTATNKVLGQAVPFVGDYGISTNPESFASENYRVYFTDKQRGAVLRLSRDGLTPISTYGMQDYFRDHLKLSNKIVGSYDDKKNNYNVSIIDINNTISYDEDVKGWSSFKSFIPEQAISMANDYYSFKNGHLWVHHSEHQAAQRNTFYDQFTPSSVKILLNDAPGVIKTFKTLNYEGSQSNINLETTDVNSGFYNLENKNGWRSDSIVTNKQDGYVSEFIEKEGKWFNYIKGSDVSDTLDIKTDEFSFQGIGKAVSIDLDPSLYVYVPPTPTPGCMDPLADNYNTLATIDDGSCTYTTPVYGCTDPNAINYDPLATVDDNSCVIELLGCTDPRASNYNPNATVDDGTCIMTPTPPVYGCTDPRAVNYDPLATIDNGTCIMGIQGCTDPNADNWDPLANQDDGTCTYSTTSGGGGPTGGGTGGGSNNANGCTDPLALNYDSSATVDDGTCIYPTLTIQDFNDDD